MQHRAYVLGLLGLGSFGALACSTSTTPGGCDGLFCVDDGGGGGGDGGVRDDGGPGYGDASPVDPCTPGCGPEELCGSGDGDGLDNDCDGEVDEGCACAANGVTRACFLGPPDRRGLGTCADGVMTCSEFLSWGPCVGGSFPEAEACDGADNDCNGVPDDGLSDCGTTLACPGTQVAAPLANHLLRGSTIFTGAATAWQWTIECPDGVSPCPAPEDPSARDTQIYLLSSGSYRARLDVTAEGGETLSCEWTIRVVGTGLRVELNWSSRGEGNGDTDVDLHLHRKSVPEGSYSGESDFFSDDDCYYSNCKATSYSDDLRYRWNIPDTTDVTACQDAPHEQGDRWSELGVCYNPRLDVDVINCDPSVTDPKDWSFCAPENINIDNPPLGQPFRVMVNYFGDHGYSGKTYPEVAIFCGGELRGSFGGDPLVTLTDGSGWGEDNENWLVADVVFQENGCGVVECMVEPLGIVQHGPDFGPDWSF